VAVQVKLTAPIFVHALCFQKMKLEEVNARTKEAVDFLVAAREPGHSRVLTVPRCYRQAWSSGGKMVLVLDDSCAPWAEDFRRCRRHPQSRTGEARALACYEVTWFTRPSPALSSTRCVHSGCRGPRCAPCIRRQPDRALPAIRRPSP
jgi:hypothetical protein